MVEEDMNKFEKKNQSPRDPVSIFSDCSKTNFLDPFSSLF